MFSIKNVRRFLILGSFGILLAVKPVPFETVAHRQSVHQVAVSRVITVGRAGAREAPSNTFVPGDLPKGAGDRGIDRE